MSELDRSDTGALTESPTLLPDRTGTESPEAPVAAPESNGAPTGTALPDGAPKKRRRRGSRGGRGRKKPGSSTGGGQPGGGASATGPETPGRSEHWTSADADRGLTDDDIAEQARDDAGLSVTADPPAVAPTVPRPEV